MQQQDKAIGSVAGGIVVAFVTLLFNYNTNKRNTKVPSWDSRKASYSLTQFSSVPMEIMLNT